jgi:hypothetical protein
MNLSDLQWISNSSEDHNKSLAINSAKSDHKNGLKPTPTFLKNSWRALQFYRFLIELYQPLDW